MSYELVIAIGQQSTDSSKACQTRVDRTSGILCKSLLLVKNMYWMVYLRPDKC